MKNRGQSGFTLIEILVAMTILAAVMSILYSTFSTSSANAKAIEERADELSSLAGAVDIISQELRSVYLIPDGSKPSFTWKKEVISFTVLSPLAKENEPAIQRVSYEFDKDALTRKTFREGEAEPKNEFLLLDEVKEPSFSFYNGKEWLEEWSSNQPPVGVKIAFSYKGRDVKTVVPFLSKK